MAIMLLSLHLLPWPLSWQWSFWIIDQSKKLQEPQHHCYQTTTNKFQITITPKVINDILVTTVRLRKQTAFKRQNKAFCFLTSLLLKKFIKKISSDISGSIFLVCLSAQPEKNGQSLPTPSSEDILQCKMTSIESNLNWKMI